MRVTIHDIAQIAGVSVSTVSRALSGKGRISPATRERIRKMAEELGYQPNVLARGLATRSTCAVGVVIHKRHLPLDERSFYGLILEIIEAEVTEHGYHVVFSTLRDHALPKCLEERRVDGVIFLGTDMEPDLIYKVCTELPVVLVDYAVPDVVSVVSDNVGGGRLATLHLLEHGHRAVAFVAETLSDPSFGERFQGYQKALVERGIRPEEKWVIEGGRRPDTDQVAMEKFLQLRKLPTAIFAANDFMAVGAIRALREAGLRVPEDVAVVGFDDGALATVVQPPLTSVRVPRKEMGKLAASCILQALHDKTVVAERIVLPTTLAVRKSCGC